MKTKFYLIAAFAFIFLKDVVAQTTITLQPGAATGKDAHLDSYYPNTNQGSSPEMNSLAWTVGGTPMAQHGILNLICRLFLQMLPLFQLTSPCIIILILPMVCSMVNTLNCQAQTKLPEAGYSTLE